jgi:hypothetical protein
LDFIDVLSPADRVQWFRAEAEMRRWQEQVELKLAELLRTSRSFRKLQEIWTKLSQHVDPGYAAYAKQKAAMYGRMARSCNDGLDRAGYGGLQSMIEGGKPLVQFVQEQRSAERALLEADYAEFDEETTSRYGFDTTPTTIY